MLTRQPDVSVSTGTTEVLVLTGRLSASREAALHMALGGAAVVHSSVRGLPDLREGTPVVLDGPQRSLSADDVARLRAHVDAGAALLAIGTAAHLEQGEPLCDLLGAHAEGSSLPRCEVFLSVAQPGAEMTRRLDTEFAIDDVVEPLQPLDAAMETLITTQVAHRRRAIVLSGRRGAGRVTVTGVGNTDAALADAQLSTVLRRALRVSMRSERRPMGVAVVGYGAFGGMGYLHGTAVTATDGLVLVAAADTSPDRLAAARRDFSGLRTYATAAELAADDDVDVVVIATPPPLHFEQALSMIRARKHVVCEKPLSLRLEEADMLFEAAADAGVAVTVNQNRRWDGDFLALRRAISAGLCGDVFNIETFAGGFEHPCRAWHSDALRSGGAVYDWGAHHVDWILELMGAAPASVSAVGHKRVWHDVTNADQIRVRMLWADGREAQFLQSDIAAFRPPKFLVQGTRGGITGDYRPLISERVEPGRGYVREVGHHAEAPVELRLRRYESGYAVTETVLPPAPERRFAFHRNLADHLLQGEPLAVTPESVCDVVAVLEAATRSAERGGVPVGLTAR